MSDKPAQDSLVFLCDCGPIIRDLMDLDALQTDVARIPGVSKVVRHVTLCSAEGKAFLAEKMRENPDLLPVVAACTPREHAQDFAEACEDAGRNPYTLSRANIREQVAWVTPDRDEATAKAFDMIAAAVARVSEQEALTAPELEADTSVLVVGSGVAGMTAALLIADSGRDVTLVEREPAIGGKVVLLSEIYPDMDCAPCLLEPLMDKVLHHPQIEVMTSAEVGEVLGYLGNFTVEVRKHSRHVEVDGCYGCIDTCSGVCPASVPDQYNAGMTERKAVYIPYAGALPNAALVNEKDCLHFNGGECVACVGACPFGVISLDGGDEVVERKVGAVIIATGSQLKLEAGTAYDIPNVMTTWEFERILNPDGPTGGEIRLRDGSTPKRIALVHCADECGGAPAASCSQTCCLALAKQALEAAHQLPDATIVELAFDRQLGGPHYVHTAESGETPANVRTVRLEVGDSVVLRAAENGTVVVTAKIGDRDRDRAGEFDLVVMAPPHVGDPEAVAMAGRMGVDVDGSGYVLTANKRLKPYASRVDGIFVAGSAQGEKDMSSATSQAAATAGAVLSALVPGKKLVREAATAVVDDTICGGCQVCVLSCPYKAISFDAERKVASVNELLCQGCGTCASACPSSAITARHFTDDQLLAEIHALTATDHPVLIS
jgi:heterodisulfide reductase subunit A2